MALLHQENPDCLECDGVHSQQFESRIDWRGKVTSQIDLGHHQFLLASKSFSGHSLVAESARRFRKQKFPSGLQPQAAPLPTEPKSGSFEARGIESAVSCSEQQSLSYVDLLGPRFHWPAPSSSKGMEKTTLGRPRSAASLSRLTTAQRRHQQQQQVQRLLHQQPEQPHRPPALAAVTIRSRPATATVAGATRISSLAARAQSALQRASPSIPSSRSGGGGSVAFSAEFEYHARQLANGKEFISHVHGLRRVDLGESGSAVGPEDVEAGRIEPSFQLTGSKIVSECPTRCASVQSARSSSGAARSAGSAQSRPAHSAKSSGKSDRMPASDLPATSSRPIPEDFKIPDPADEAEKLQRWQEAVDDVDIHKIFSHPYLAPDHAKKFDSAIIEQGLRERMAVLKIQREFRRHLQRKRRIESRPVSAKNDWTAGCDRQLRASAAARRTKLAEKQAELSEQTASIESKLEVIGPHVEVYQSYHLPRVGPTQRQRHIAAVIIQKTVRGHLVRRFLRRLTAKARLHGFSSLRDFLAYYCALIRRIVRSATGATKRAEVRFDMDQLDQFMEDKRRLEIGFDSTAFEGGLGERDLMKLFNVCGFFPARREVADTLEAFHGSRRRVKGAAGSATLSKSDAVEIFFHIFKPAGTGLSGDRKSTWMHPIINGEDAAKYVTPEELPPTPLSRCIRLVTTARLDRLPIEKQVDLRRNLRQLDKMEQMRQERLQAASSARIRGKAARSKGSALPQQRRMSAAPTAETEAEGAPVKIKIQWMKD